MHGKRISPARPGTCSSSHISAPLPGGCPEGTSPRRLDARVAAAERVCVNLDTLRSGIEVSTVTEVVGVGAN